MLRTCGPMATTSAHVSRRDTSAVAGMRMPERDRRSPSLRGICTITRSDSMVMGCLLWASSLVACLPGTQLTVVDGDGLARADSCPTRAAVGVEHFADDGALAFVPPLVLGV